jgi:hypothetical protein
MCIFLGPKMREHSLNPRRRVTRKVTSLLALIVHLKLMGKQIRAGKRRKQSLFSPNVKITTKVTSSDLNKKKRLHSALDESRGDLE